MAFVQHYLDVLNAGATSARTLDATAAVLREAVSVDDCQACHGWIASLEDTWLDGGRVEGGEYDGEAGLPCSDHVR